MDVLQDLFTTFPFIAHKHSFNNQEAVFWMHVVGDIVTAIAFYIIPILLAYFTWKKKNLKYKPLFWLFSAFIMLCGTTYILAVIGMWEPYYRLEGIFKLATALVSIIAALLLIPIIHKVLNLPTREDLTLKNRKLSAALNELKQKLEEQKMSTELLIASHELAKLGSWEWNLKTDQLKASEEYFKIFNAQKPTEQITVYWFFDQVHPNDVEEIETIVKKAMASGDVDVRFRVILSDKSIKHIHSKARVQYNTHGEPVSIVGTSLDITKQVNNKIALKEYTEKMEANNKYLKRIAYATSHYLKEPLRGMVLYSQMVLKLNEDELSYEAKDKLNFVVDEGKRMNKMIESLLSFSKIESVEPELTEVDMNKILVEVLQRFRVSIKETNADIETSSLPVVTADEEHMNIVMRNLISNALKYSRKEPRIKVSAVKVGPEWEIRVQDNGIGFSKKFNDEIFGHFKTLDSKSGTSSSGIGLSLCRTIIQAHGGRIWAISREGQGSTFHFTLPIIS